jgi:phosphatidate cytidylyltransferase
LSPETRERLFGYQHAFDHPVTLGVTIALGVIFLVVPLLFLLLDKLGKLAPKLRTELWQRYFSWLVIAAALLVPILAGALWTILAMTLLSLLCYREYARATGFFRERLMSLQVVLGILLINFAALDNWLAFFMALQPLTMACLAGLTILADRPQGYIQRVALAVFGFSLFGVALSHLSFIANDANYRPILLLIFLSVELNDVFAFMVGKTLGQRKFAPHTSPNKTEAGSLGSLVLTTVLVYAVGSQVFAGTEMAHPVHLGMLGVLISFAGQLGDLMLSSIKRDLGIKDMGALIPGHGGLLDRFDSIILVAPAVFHYVHYVLGIGNGQPTRILTGG